MIVKDIVNGRKYEKIIKASLVKVKDKYPELLFGSYFGALDVGKENYFVYFVFKSNKELNTARKEGICISIEDYWKKCMTQLEYEKDYIKSSCDFASQEECEKQFGGNWYYYYK